MFDHVRVFELIQWPIFDKQSECCHKQHKTWLSQSTTMIIALVAYGQVQPLWCSLEQFWRQIEMMSIDQGHDHDNDQGVLLQWCLSTWMIEQVNCINFCVNVQLSRSIATRIAHSLQWWLQVPMFDLTINITEKETQSFTDDWSYVFVSMLIILITADAKVGFSNSNQTP